MLLRSRRFEMPSAVLWALLAEKYFLFCVCRGLRAAPNAFSQERTFRIAASAAAGLLSVAQRLQIGGTQKSGEKIFTPNRRESSAFLSGAYFFGVERGEQPFSRASRASKVAGAFLVLFCARKRVHTRRRCILQKALNFKHATTLCARNLYFSTFRLCRVQNSFAGCKLRAGLCQRPGGGTGS